MELFPQVDPIPLPAPVWMFKLLNDVTLILHFYAVHFLVGGLAVATVWALMGRWSSNAAMSDGANQISHRLPIVMTFVINLGVPPLLFTQVLYGRALYTSSVLIGLWWISVIFLIMLAYSLLYVMAKRADAGRAWGWASLIALIVVLKVGMIYSSNMTLMNRPEVWREMYARSGIGMYLPSGDPTILPRWSYMMLSSIGVTGLALLFLPTRLPSDSETSVLLRRWGGRLVSVFSVVQIAVGYLVFRLQPAAIREDLLGNGLYLGSIGVWLATSAGLVVLGIPAGSRKGLALPFALALLSFVNLASMVLVRDGVRDLTLLAAGLNVWDRTVVTNWSTVILFLLLFVAAAIATLWLGKILVTAQSRRVEHG